MCHAITDYASSHDGVFLNASYFRRPKLCCYTAVVGAEADLFRVQESVMSQEEARRLAFALEMRTALSRAFSAHGTNKNGATDFAGSTNRVLQDALSQMRYLIDRSVTEARGRIEPTVDRPPGAERLESCINTEGLKGSEELKFSS